MPPLAPRPFTQAARRHYRMFHDAGLGFRPFLDGAPWYRQKRRSRPVFTPSYTSHPGYAPTPDNHF